jgi:hypothetical protein
LQQEIEKEEEDDKVNRTRRSDEEKELELHNEPSKSFVKY